MSETQPKFREASARRMPTLACIGSVAAIGTGKISGSGKYIVQPIELGSLEAGKDLRLNFLYKPEWLSPGFDPDSLEEVEGGDSMLSVYRRHISGRGALSNLSGIAGTDERFEALSGALLSQEPVTVEGTEQILNDFFFGQDAEDVTIGYIAKQQSTRTDDIDPKTGKNVYVLENRYEVSSFFRFDEKTIKSLANRANKSNGKFRLTFEAGVPF